VVSLQVHPELLKDIISLCGKEVKNYFQMNAAAPQAFMITGHRPLLSVEEQTHAFD
jgi:hypothetical protein